MDKLLILDQLMDVELTLTVTRGKDIKPLELSGPLLFDDISTHLWHVDGYGFSVENVRAFILKYTTSGKMDAEIIVKDLTSDAT